MGVPYLDEVAVAVNGLFAEESRCWSARSPCIEIHIVPDGRIG